MFTGTSGRSYGCPQCHTAKTRLSPSRSFVDRLLGLFTIYYLRCQLCAHRFPIFLARRLPPARRSYQRLPVTYPASFRSASETENPPVQEGTVLNLTIRGCRLRCDPSMPIGARVVLEFQPSPYSIPITVDGAVVRSQSADGLGLRFVKLSRCEERRIGRVMDLYLKESPSEILTG